MGHLNYEFFDEFKSLDNLCKDIYGESIDHKLGVTLYLEDMTKNAYQGSMKISGWSSDYNQLKSARNIRNELAHSRNSFSYDICSQKDIEFVRSFKTRILNQTDPIALLRKQPSQPRPRFDCQTPPPKPDSTYNIPKKTTAGCLSIVSSFLVIVAFIIAFLL